MGNKSQLMWQKGYAIKTKNHTVVDMCIGVPVFFETQCICHVPTARIGIRSEKVQCTVLAARTFLDLSPLVHIHSSSFDVSQSSRFIKSRQQQLLEVEWITKSR